MWKLIVATQSALGVIVNVSYCESSDIFISLNRFNKGFHMSKSNMMCHIDDCFISEFIFAQLEGETCKIKPFKDSIGMNRMTFPKIIESY